MRDPFNHFNKYLPTYSLRVKGTTHTYIHVIKELCFYDNVDDVLEALVQNFINSHPKREILNNYAESKNKIKIDKALRNIN